VTATAEPEGDAPEGHVPLDPFEGHLSFARSVRGGTFTRAWFGFIDSLRPPIDVRADRILDLEAMGQMPALIIKAPRLMREDEYPEGLEDRMKEDCERQFTLRNIGRAEREAYPDEKLEMDHRPVDAGGFVFPELADMGKARAAPALLEETSYQFVYNASRWRWTMLEVMQWERHFCKELKDTVDGPLWRYDPDAPRDDKAEAAPTQAESASDQESTPD